MTEPTLTLTIPDVTLGWLKSWAQGCIYPSNPVIAAAKAALEQYEREHQPYYVTETQFGFFVYPKNGGTQECFIRKTIPDAEATANELCTRLNREAGK